MGASSSFVARTKAASWRRVAADPALLGAIAAVWILLPLFSPPFTTSISIIFSFGPRGFISHDLLGLTNVSAYGFWSTALAETLTYFPIAYLTLRPILAAIDPNLEEMA